MIPGRPKPDRGPLSQTEMSFALTYNFAQRLGTFAGQTLTYSVPLADFDGHKANAEPLVGVVAEQRAEQAPIIVTEPCGRKRQKLCGKGRAAEIGPSRPAFVLGVGSVH